MKKKSVKASDVKAKSKAAPKAKKAVKKATSKKKEETVESDFPGYPLYAAADDIMNRSSRVDRDMEHPKGSPTIAPYTPSIDSEDEEKEIATRKSKSRNDDFEVTGEDLEALGTSDLESDGGEDEELKKRATPVDFSGNDLDVPGSEDDDQQESVGSEDEENNSYSLGGDDHDDLEEDKA
jgi:hypothetical protein